MKKAFILCGALLLLTACKKEEKEIESTTVTETVSDTVVREVAPPPPAEIEPESDGTSISIGSDGVSVDSKDGKKKTTVNVSKDNADVEINN